MRVIDEKISVREQLVGLPEGALFPELLRQYRLRTLAETTDDLKLVRDIALLVDRNEYKRKQSAPGLKITSRAFGFGRPFPIAQKFIP